MGKQSEPAVVERRPSRLHEDEPELEDVLKGGSELSDDQEDNCQVEKTPVVLLLAVITTKGRTPLLLVGGVADGPAQVLCVLASLVQQGFQ